MSSPEPRISPRAVVASGAGRYADPWHLFRHTSSRIEGILRDDGWEVDVVDDPDRALASLDDASLLVVNAGDPWRGGESGRGTDPAAEAGLDDAIGRGIGILAVHIALSSLRDYPRWREAIGGEWVDGRSWHPPIADVVVPIVDRGHPVTADLSQIVLFDELYTDLTVDPGVRVLAAYERDAASHPIVWVRDDPTRIVVTALGHDERSYDSVTQQTLVRNAARWAGTGRMGGSPAHLSEE